MSDVEYMVNLPLRDAQGNVADFFVTIVEGEFIGISLTERNSGFFGGNRRISVELRNRDDIARLIKVLTLQLNQM